MITRRNFFGASVGMGLAMGVPPRQEFKTKLKKALISKKPSEAALKKIKDAGFDGVEGGIIKPKEAEACRAVAEKLGMRIHSVMRGWANFNSPKKEAADASFKVTEDAIRAAEGFGADAILLVPCRIGGQMPAPWDFKLDFDPETGHLKKVVEGDNAPYEDFIKAHNHAEDTSREYIKRLIPLAEKSKVIVAVENVWNNLWNRPDHFTNFVASFKSPWVQAYFDLGNHVKYAPPQEWLEALGKLVVKLHVKDFKLDKSSKRGGGFVAIRDGSVDWPVVRKTIEKIGYSGWMTIEGGGLKPEEASKRLDLIIAGK